MPHISLAAEKIGMLAFLPVTNSLLTTWVVMGVLMVFAFVLTRSIHMKPGALQVMGETVIEGLYNLFRSVTGEYVGKFFPLLATIFFFVLFGNWSGLLPGVGSIGIKHEEIEAEETAPTTSEVSIDTQAEGIPIATVSDTHESTPAENEKNPALTPLFRAPTADLNTTLALAIIAVLAIQYYGFQILGGIYLGKFFNFKNPIMFFVGLLELVSEFTKIISFAFRLFGNIFAGEVLLAVIAFLMPVVVPLPFLGLEIFVGMVQALVFSMLTAVFLNIATVAHDEH